MRREKLKEEAEREQDEELRLLAKDVKRNKTPEDTQKYIEKAKEFLEGKVGDVKTQLSGEVSKVKEQAFKEVDDQEVKLDQKFEEIK